MNALRGSTASPISIEKIWSAAAGVVDRDQLQRALLGIHRGVGELVGVHLAEALEALERRRPRGDLEHARAQVLERQRLGRRCLPSTTSNGGVPASSLSSACTFTKPAYSGASNMSRCRR